MTIATTLSRIRIGPRIYAGFLFVLMLVVLVSVVAYTSADNARGYFDNLKTIRDRETAILELDRAVVTLQRSAENYTFTGNESVARRVREDIQQLTRRLGAVDAVLAGPREHGLLDRMGRHFDVYADTFANAVTERTLRQELVQTGFADTLAAFSAAVREVRQQVPDSPTVLALETDMRAAELNLYRYLHDPQYNLLVDAKRTLDQRIRQFEGSAPTDSSEAHGAARARLVASVRRFQREFTRTVQATRSYLYLIGVVMAGEAQEFRYVSSQLRDAVLRQGEPIATRIAQATDDGKRTATLASIVAVLSALLISWLIARSISIPIAQMTQTFEKLADGDDDASIPALARGDEIGIMAQAANVFREKNQETRQLLRQAQELTEKLDEHKRELERSNDELEQFVYTVSHDLKSPIVTSLGFIGMMRKLADRGKVDKAMAKLDTLERANRRMSQLIEDLLDLSRVGRVDRDLTRLDMNILLRDLVEGMQKKLSDGGLRVVIDADLPPVMANESRVLQVFDNLIGNAMKYAVTEDGGTVTIGGAVIEDEVRFFVQDDGPGIQPQFHERVFGLFQRLQTDKKGTGIGLAIVMKVMQFHRGRVWIESSGDGDGARFWLAFPIEDRRAAHGEAA